MVRHSRMTSKDEWTWFFQYRGTPCEYSCYARSTLVLKTRSYCLTGPDQAILSIFKPSHTKYRCFESLEMRFGANVPIYDSSFFGFYPLMYFRHSDAACPVVVYGA